PVGHPAIEIAEEVGDSASRDRRVHQRIAVPGEVAANDLVQVVGVGASAIGVPEAMGDRVARDDAGERSLVLDVRVERFQVNHSGKFTAPGSIRSSVNPFPGAGGVCDAAYTLCGWRTR